MSIGAHCIQMFVELIFDCILEVPNYLSVEETKMIIAAALDNGMETSGVLGEEIENECETANDLTEVIFCVAILTLKLFDEIKL